MRKIISILAAVAVLLSLGAASWADGADAKPYMYDEDISIILAYDYLMNEMGFNRAVATGIIANLVHESGIRTTALGDGGTSFGLCQWHNERWVSLKLYADSLRLPMEDITAQLKYLRHELEGDYREVLDYLITLPDTEDGAYSAAYCFSLHFERPAGLDSSASVRGRTARSLYNREIKNISYSIPVMKILYMLTIYEQTYHMPTIGIGGEDIVPRGTDTYISEFYGGASMYYGDGYWSGVNRNPEGWETWNPDGQVSSTWDENGFAFETENENPFDFAFSEQADTVIDLEDIPEVTPQQEHVQEQQIEPEQPDESSAVQTQEVIQDAGTDGEASW